MAFSHGHALVIGVGSNKYDSKWDVPVTANDAREIAGILQDSDYCGYPKEQVRLLHDDTATRDGILGALDELAQKVKPDDTLLVFYSGHGDFSAERSFHLVSHDTQFDQVNQVVKDTGISQEALLARLREVKAGRLLMIFNSCYSGEISPTLGGPEKPASPNLPAPAAEALLATGSGRILITACRENQKSYFLINDPLTLFTQSLADALKGKTTISKGGFINAFDLYMALYNNVSEAVQQRYKHQQEPELTILKGVGPFAVALYNGAASGVQSLAENKEEQPASYAAVRQVPRERAEYHLQQFMQVYQQQVNQSGGINFGQANVIKNLGNIVAGDLVQGDKVMGNKSTTTINTGGGSYIGSNFTTQGGDFVGRDKNVYGDQISANITGSTGIAIGRGAQSVVHSYGAGGATAQSLSARFDNIYNRINRRPADPDVEKDELTDDVRRIYDEVIKGEGANANKVARWLNGLKDTAPDIHQVVVDALKSAGAEVSAAIRNSI